MSSDYYCFATLMLPDYEAQIVSHMAKSGYKVRTGITGDKFMHDNASASIVFVLMVNTDKKANDISTDFTRALKKSKAKYYSTFTVLVGDSTFSAGNIFLPEEVEPAKNIIED